MAELLRGSPVAKRLNEETKQRADRLREKGIIPVLAIVRTGDRDDAVGYERSAVKSCLKQGIEARCIRMDDDTEKEVWLDEIKKLSADDTVHGILVLSPIPASVSKAELGSVLAPQKDVDGITPGSQAGVYSGSGMGYPPCTADACLRILEHYGIELCGKNAVVVGRSLTVGRPAAMMLMAKNATVTICHTRTVDMEKIARQADILIAATGVARSVGGDAFSEGQTVIDVGFHEDGAESFCGDVDFNTAMDIAAAVTPVPGGVGTVTTAILMSHTVDAAEKAARS